MGWTFTVSSPAHRSSPFGGDWTKKFGLDFWAWTGNVWLSWTNGTFIWSNDDGLDWTLFCEWAWAFGLLKNGRNAYKTFKFGLFHAISFWSFTTLLALSTVNSRQKLRVCGNNNVNMVRIGLGLTYFFGLSMDLDWMDFLSYFALECMYCDAVFCVRLIYHQDDRFLQDALGRCFATTVTSELSYGVMNWNKTITPLLMASDKKHCPWTFFHR